ncbi:2-succinyl-6-hydroxy-2,4-cyclohexadiene-1-carboxylate synthase [Nitratireductor thuwali]|uniref:2-succinyl-6-hydroxy-2, 4-cyclohexadiene-1-carboxylate synthase n=2 Tax=Nitratireductor thuwali TaxID=2267699 RepID=A0ABY5MCN9_9HYPH|nr:2-succinyl-6-hydroxy-2,4-cyclohexadiene-1-carboxylate synthase [Nitratireductor thuwali]
MLEARRHCLKSAYGYFVAHEFRPQGAWRGRGTILVTHGWGSRSEYMRAIIGELRAHGFRVIALDLPGHGASSGRRLHMASAVAAVKTVQDWFGPFAGLVGHSFGGTVLVNALKGSVNGLEPVDAGRLALIASPNSMPDLFAYFSRELGLGRRSREAFFDRVERVTGSPLSEFVVARQAASLAVPIMVLHAPDDREVPFADAQAIAAGANRAGLRPVDGAGHRRILSDPATLAHLAEFFAGQRLLAAAE